MGVKSRGSSLVSACLLFGLYFPALSSCLCSPLDTTWTQYISTPAPQPFEGTETASGGTCSMMTGSQTCSGPGIPGIEGRLSNGNLGLTALDVGAVHAWDETVSIQFIFSTSVSVAGINLYFYNIPSRGIGLPYNIRSTSSNQPSIGHAFATEGNLDLSEDDNQLRNVTLVPVGLSGTAITIQFTFSLQQDKILWLLLTEVQICTGAVPVPDPQPITFTDDTLSSVSPTTVNSSITLRCSVANEGRFDWSWMTPSGAVPPPIPVVDFGRTSFIELTQLSSDMSGDYQCRADHTFGSGNTPATFDITLTLTGMLQEDSDTVVVTASDETASLRCVLSGYLPSGQEPSISWLLGSTTLINDTDYTITYEEGDGLIQNGGNQPRPSLTSTLTINLTNIPVSMDRVYTCFSGQVTSPGIRAITLTSNVPPVPDTTSPVDPNTPGPTNIPTTQSSLPVIIGAIVGVIVIIVIVIVIVIVLILVLRKRNKMRSETFIDDYNDTKDPLYQEVNKPMPPPLPVRFPTLSVSDIGPYAVVDNCLGSGQMELVNMNGNRNSITSVPDPNNPTPLRLKNQPGFLQNNPLYASADHIDRNGDAPSLPYRRTIGSVGSMDEISNSTHGSILNIYAQPFRVAPPIPERPPTPCLLDDGIYSEAISPNMLSEKRYSTPPGVSEDLCPQSSVYADPKPLLKSEGPIEVAPQQVREIRSLGVGQFGQVVLAETNGLSLKDLHLSDSNNDKNVVVLVAIKKLKPDADDGIKEAFEKEIKFMSRLNDDNVVRLLGICSYGDAFIVMEYMENGDLNQYLHKHAEDTENGVERLSPSVLLYIAMQISSGMMYLATLKFIHRDLATRNCLVGSKNEVKIADFGMSRSLYSSYYYRIRGRAMLPIRWMANECFYGRFSEKTDIWAFGVTMWEIFTFGMKQPYDELNDQEVIDNAVRGADRMLPERPEYCPPEVYEVMLRCWDDDPDTRANFVEVHSSLAEIYDNSVFT